MMKTSLLVMATLLAATALAGENGKKPKREGPLAKLPSAEGAHIAKIKALGDGQWLNLGRPRTDPKWGDGRGRSWCARMNFSPELRGAFLTGEGRHAFIKPDGYYMDDFFFYDLNAHAWVCVHPGVKAGDDQGLKLSKDGLTTNQAGDPIPCGVLAHNYDQVAYDPHQKKLGFFPKGGATGWWITMKCKQVKALSKEAASRMSGKGWSPWYYNSATGKFEREVIKSQGPTGGSVGGCLQYLAKHRKFFLRYARAGTNWLYDTGAKTWKKVAARPKVVMGTDTVSCYDTKRGLLYMAGGNAKGAKSLLCYDAATDKWTELPSIPEGARFTGNSGHMTYDSAGDVVVANVRGIKKMFFYSPEKKKWLGDQTIDAKVGGAAFYDPKLNVHFYFRAGDSRDKGEMWTYRYKRAAKK